LPKLISIICLGYIVIPLPVSTEIKYLERITQGSFLVKDLDFVSESLPLRHSLAITWQLSISIIRPIY
jgi:hypothetical protein